MMKIGYIRVCRGKQTTAVQEDAMRKEQCERVLTDKMSGKCFDRSEFLCMLDIKTMAEFERDVISERAPAGLEAARVRGRRSRRPKAIEKIEPRNLARAKELYAAKKNTIQEIMQMTLSIPVIVPPHNR